MIKLSVNHTAKFTWAASQDLDALIKEFSASIKNGLSEEQVIPIRLQHGYNEILSHQVSWWHILTRQFKSPFIYILLAAVVLAVILKEFVDAAMITFFVVINGALGFYQEFHTEKVLRLLKNFVSAQATVLRSGKKNKISDKELVPGDIVFIKAGDLVPADIRFVETENVRIDESVLSGESVPVDKGAQVLKQKPVDIHEAQNIGFFGTTVVSGEGKGLVIATGMRTIMGGISKLTTETVRVSSFEKGILKFSKFTLIVILSTLAFVILANVLFKSNTLTLGNLLLFAIALAVGVIPEALPTVITFSLSRGALKLSKNKVVVKRLSAIEDLGSIEVLCSDKTGTLTENVLEVDQIEAKDDQTLLYCALSGTILSQNSALTEAFDLAVWKKLGSDQKRELKDFRLINEIPFDPQRRLSSTLVKKDRTNEIVLRGAPEEVLRSCTNLKSAEIQRLMNIVSRVGKRGRRVLGVARKKYSGAKVYAQKDEATGFTFCGLVSFVDPVKKTAKDAIIKAQKMGVVIKILTGDSKEVAGAVAHEVGLVKSPEEVVTGEEFHKLTLGEKRSLVEKTHVFARTSPEQKFEIIEILEATNEVGFLGEGINDAPALKIANVALVVSGASDIAREAADIILLKKSLRVIIDGIEEGRSVFANTMKYIRATLSSNFGNFYAVSIVSLFVDYLPMMPTQILLLNLLTDLPMIVVATDTVDTAELKAPKTYNLKDFGVLSTALGLVSSVFDFIVFRTFLPFGTKILQTNWYIASVATELVLLFSIRTRGWFFKAKMPSLSLIILTVVTLILSLVIPFTKSGRDFFAFIQPTPTHLLTVATIVFIYFILSELVKIVYYKTFYVKTLGKKQKMKEFLLPHR